MGRVTVRERAAFHEAGHVIGWLSAPAPPSLMAISIEPDRRRGFTGEVRLRAPSSAALRLDVGRALSRGNLRALAPALAAVGAQVRAHASGPVAEALRVGVRLTQVPDGEWDYWTAYELSAAVGLEPQESWRREVRRARRFLRRHWEEVGHLARLLLELRPGRRRLAGAPLQAFARRMETRRTGQDRYDDDARALLAAHRARWRGAHWAVLEAIPEQSRRTAVAWADHDSVARAIAAELAHVSPGRLEVARRRRR